MNIGNFLNAPSINPELFVPPKNHNLADEFHRRLIVWINDFHKSLDNEHEVGARLVTFGQSMTIHIEDIGYWNPSLISFKGRSEDGNPVELIQHVSQISVLLIALKRERLDVPKRPIGFSNWEEYEKGVK